MLLPIVLPKCSQVQIAFLKFTSCDNQSLVWCILIAAIAVNLNLKKNGQSSHKMYNNNVVNFQESTTMLNAYTKKSLETYWRHLVTKKNLSTCGFSCPTRQLSDIIESKKSSEYLDLTRKLKTNYGIEGDSDTNCNWYTWKNPQRIGKRTGRVGKWKHKMRTFHRG